jgi:glycosyltransferase involved in cell wall biosynthesis
MPDPLPHVCFVAPNAFPLLSGDDKIQLIGGAELQVVIVARRLAARGRRVSMICLDFGQQDRIEVDGITVFRAYRPNEGIPVLRFVWPRLISIWQCLKRADADIYYQQTAGILTGVMAAFCKAHARKSVFASASNPDLLPTTPRIRYARDRWIYSYGLRHVDEIFVQNEEQALLCRTNLGREPILVPNCYPMPLINRSVNEKRKCILWVSTIRKLKRPELFLNLAEALPNHEFRMIGGPDDDEPTLFKSIQARANNMANVLFLGFLPFWRTEEQFDQAMLFVNTSDSEGFPNSFLQAWARGIPTVSFVDPGASLEGKPIGLRAKSWEGMLATVGALASDDQARLLIGQRCVSYVETCHSPEKVLALYEQVFEQLMKPHSCATGPPLNRNQQPVARDRRK